MGYSNENKPECKACNDTGFILITEKSEKGGTYEFAVACDCPKGDDKVYDGRIISDEKHRSNYICPRYSSLLPKI